MKGLELFKSLSPNLSDDFDYVENIMGFKLPKMYKLFTSTYLLGIDNLLIPKFLDPKFNSISECVSVFIKRENPFEEYYFGGIFNSKELLKDWKSYSSVDDEFSKYGLLRIATLGIGGGLFLGLKDDKKDKIYLVNWDGEENYSLLADNIFEFVKKLVVSEDGSNMASGINYSQLYKNWGEDFWRVKE